MKTLYLDCGMGAAGDMLAAALLELLPQPEAVIKELNALGIPGVVYQRASVQKCGILGTHLTVTVNGEEEKPDAPHTHEHEHEHEHTHGHEHQQGHPDPNEAHEHLHRRIQDIAQIIEALPLSARVKTDIFAVYQLIAAAESRVHGVPVSEIHFHEVGAMDAIADITAVCLLMEKLAPQQVVVSPIHVGSGHVRCAHGILPVPAPATADILRGIPIYGGVVKGELCTPTGAALLKHFATSFGDMPVLRAQAIGYGMGKKDFTAANCVRALLGETQGSTEQICVLCCNLDDMTGEEIGFAFEQLLAAGALDVYTVPVGMKKNRPGILLCVMCNEDQKNEMTRLLFQHTSTLGVRETTSRRYMLERFVETQSTPYGKVRRKRAHGYETAKEKLEFEDLARIAREKNISLTAARALVDGVPT